MNSKVIYFLQMKTSNKNEKNHQGATREYKKKNLLVGLVIT